MNQYFKWADKSGEAYAKVPGDYAYPYILGGTEASIVSLARNNPSLIEITELEWERWAQKWGALSGS